MKGGTVSVKVDRTFPVSLPPTTSLPDKDQTVASFVRDAWLEYHWKRGGGLPIYVLQGTNDESSLEGSKRTIAPVMMEETILDETSGTNERECELLYMVTKPGPFFQTDLVPDSHKGTVKFQSLRDKYGQDQCRMTWEVTFDTARFNLLYQSFTEFTVGTAARTVEEAARTPQTLVVQTTLNMKVPQQDEKSTKQQHPAIEAGKQWVDFFWYNGGGLPMPPSIHFGDKLFDPLEKGPRLKLLRLPVIVESLRRRSKYRESSSWEYAMDNPGWLTFPILIHTHKGKVQFALSTDSPPSDDRALIDMIWEVEIRPFAFMAPIVKKLIEMSVSTATRNLQAHLLEPNAVVTIQAPRGKKLPYAAGLGA
ncbi:MAG: hypothetical protein SGARI_000578 [Bacillariaceae sp.]